MSIAGGRWPENNESVSGMMDSPLTTAENDEIGVMTQSPDPMGPLRAVKRKNDNFNDSNRISTSN